MIRLMTGTDLLDYSVQTVNSQRVNDHLADPSANNTSSSSANPNHDPQLELSNGLQLSDDPNLVNRNAVTSSLLESIQSFLASLREPSYGLNGNPNPETTALSLSTRRTAQLKQGRAAARNERTRIIRNATASNISNANIANTSITNSGKDEETNEHLGNDNKTDAHPQATNNIFGPGHIYEKTNAQRTFIFDRGVPYTEPNMMPARINSQLDMKGNAPTSLQ